MAQASRGCEQAWPSVRRLGVPGPHAERLLELAVAVSDSVSSLMPTAVQCGPSGGQAAETRCVTGTYERSTGSDGRELKRWVCLQWGHRAATLPSGPNINLPEYRLAVLLAAMEEALLADPVAFLQSIRPGHAIERAELLRALFKYRALTLNAVNADLEWFYRTNPNSPAAVVLALLFAPACKEQLRLSAIPGFRFPQGVDTLEWYRKDRARIDEQRADDAHCRRVLAQALVHNRESEQDAVMRRYDNDVRIRYATLVRQKIER